jgi:hypothetical protein
MWRNFAYWVIFILIAGLAGVFGFQAVQAFRQPTVVVEWSTASELNTVGFNVYRSETKDGPIIKVNDHLIPSAADSVKGGNYTYRDSTVTLGQTYYYWLEDVSSNGTTNKNGPIVVKAESGGLSELLASLSLGLIVLVGFYFLIFRQKKSEILPDG